MAEEWFIKNVINNLTTFLLSSMMCATALCERKHYSVSFWQMWSVIMTPSMLRRLKEFTLLKIVAIKLMVEEWFTKNVINSPTNLSHHQ